MSADKLSQINYTKPEIVDISSVSPIHGLCTTFGPGDQGGCDTGSGPGGNEFPCSPGGEPLAYCGGGSADTT